MVSVKKLDVCIAGVKVGTLAVTDNYLCAFEYSDEWLMNGYSISPFSLPLEKKVFIPKLDIENPIIRINTAFKGCSSLEKISVLPRIYHN